MHSYRCRGIHWSAASLVFLATVWVSGCGGSSVKVSGTVRDGAQPVEGAEVLFKSLDDEGSQFTGVTVEGGKLYVGGDDGLPKGKYEITIKRYVLPGGKPLPEGEAAEELKDSGKAKLITKTYQREIQSSDPLKFDLSKNE